MFVVSGRNDVRTLEVLSQIKSQAAQAIEKACDDNQKTRINLAVPIIKDLSEFSPESKRRQLEKSTVEILKQAVELHAIFLKSKALFAVTEVFDAPANKPIDDFTSKPGGVACDVVRKESSTPYADRIAIKSIGEPSEGFANATGNESVHALADKIVNETDDDFANEALPEVVDSLVRIPADEPRLKTAFKPGNEPIELSSNASASDTSTERAQEPRNHSLTEFLAESLAYNPSQMEVCLHETEKDQPKRLVGTVVSPMLVKIGNADGEGFDHRMVLCKAQVTVK